MRILASRIRQWSNARESHLSGEKFEKIADFSFKVGSQIPRHARVIFCKITYAHLLFDQIRRHQTKYVVITHNGDHAVSWAMNQMAWNLPDNVLRWFAQNADVEHPKIQGIPIGIANTLWPHGNFLAVKKVQRENIPQNKLAYLCAKIRTNGDYRRKVYDVCRQKPFITVKGGDTPVSGIEYLRDIAAHKFTISPKGHGADAHRTWEALYLGSIPIVEKTFALRHFENLPIMFVENYENLNQRALEVAYEKMRQMVWNHEILNISYWNKLIRSFL